MVSLKRFQELTRKELIMETLKQIGIVAVGVAAGMAAVTAITGIAGVFLAKKAIDEMMEAGEPTMAAGPTAEKASAKKA